MAIEIFKNSFISAEDAQVYFEERFDSNKWFELSDEEKEKLLISASKKINTFEFVGNQADDSQPMAFPRDYELPADIKEAVCEEAFAMASQKGDIHSENKKAGISSISLGVGSVSYRESAGTGNSAILVSNDALNLISKWVKKGYKFS